MLKHLLLLMVVMALVPGCAHSMAARSGDGAAAVIETGDPRECYTDMFNSMIKAVGNDHLYKLVEYNKPYAEDVILAWSVNINEAPAFSTDQTLQGLLTNLHAVLPEDTYRFPELIAKRLNGKLETECPKADQALDALVAAKIGFPLFDKNFDPDLKPEDRLEVAAQFARKAFKKLSWEKLYVDSTYSSKKYTPEVIAVWIGDGQKYGVIPYINDEIWKCSNSTGDGATTLAANSQCCCNTSSHSTFRKCRTGTTGQNCTPAPPSNCVLASQNCSAHAAH